MMNELETFELIDDFEASDLRMPPKKLLFVALGFLAVALILFAFNNSKIGYGLSVLVMILNSVVSHRDQKSQADPNYVTLDWFRPMLILCKIGILLVALGHITVLAIESAR